MYRKPKWIRIVKGRGSGLRYYKGDGLHFRRIGEDKAIKGLASKEYRLWERAMAKPKR